jgi:hypothetical protein
VVPQHGGRVLSTAQEEEAYLAALKPFKATPYDPSAVSASVVQAPFERRRLTTPLSPEFQTNKRLGKKLGVPEAPPSPVQQTFKARPMPSSTMAGTAMLSGATLRRAAATVPISPPLQTRARADMRPQVPVEDPHFPHFKAAGMPDYSEMGGHPRVSVEHKAPTKQQPFTLRTDERHTHSVAALEAAQAQKAEIEAAARRFRAREVGQGVSHAVHVGPPNIPRAPTVQQPFALSEPSYHAPASVESGAPTFKAKPVPTSLRGPVVPFRAAPRRTVKSCAKPLASDARAAKRAAYELAKAKREATRAERAAEADAAKLAAEDEALRVMRKATAFRARPVGAGVPSLRAGGLIAPRRAPTVPVSPKLGPTAYRSNKSARAGGSSIKRVPFAQSDNQISA